MIRLTVCVERRETAEAFSVQGQRSQTQPRHIPNPSTTRTTNNLRHTQTNQDAKEDEKTHYGNVTKRIRELQDSGYIRESCGKTTKAGFQAIEYELTTKTYLALSLDAIELENALDRTDEDVALELLAAMARLF